MRSLFIILTLILSLNAEHISWRGDFDKALFDAKKEQKNILFLLVKKESSKTILVDIFSNQDVIKKVNSNYIAIIGYYEDKHSYPIELFYTQTFPSIFFVSYKDESFLSKPLSGNFTINDLLINL